MNKNDDENCQTRPRELQLGLFLTSVNYFQFIMEVI